MENKVYLVQVHFFMFNSYEWEEDITPVKVFRNLKDAEAFQKEKMASFPKEKYRDHEVSITELPIS